MSDCIVGLISGPSVNIWFMHSLINFFKSDKDDRFHGDYLLVFGPYIHQNRNQLVQDFLNLERQRDWLFMVDNDIVFNPEDVWCILAEADKRGPGVYSAAYLIEDGSMVCGPWDAHIEKAYHPLLALPENPTEIGVVGAGFTLIHRKVFETIGEEWFTALEPKSGEDISFSWRARENGFTPWLIPKANPGHFKQLVLYPHQQVRNMVGEEVNLVQADPSTPTPA